MSENSKFHDSHIILYFLFGGNNWIADHCAFIFDDVNDS